MSRGFRWTEEDHKAFEARAEQYRKIGTVRSHECADKPKPGSSKYGNERVFMGGHYYASKKEGRRGMALAVMERAGSISKLDRQVCFRLEVNGVHVCDYIADFAYVHFGKQVVEDCKGYRTDVYKLKKALMKACHGIEVREI